MLILVKYSSLSCERTSYKRFITVLLREIYGRYATHKPGYNVPPVPILVGPAVCYSLVRSFQIETKELVATDGEAVLCLPRKEDGSTLASCSHEEADTRIMPYVAHG